MKRRSFIQLLGAIGAALGGPGASPATASPQKVASDVPDGTYGVIDAPRAGAGYGDELRNIVIDMNPCLIKARAETRQFAQYDELVCGGHLMQSRPASETTLHLQFYVTGKMMADLQDAFHYGPVAFKDPPHDFMRGVWLITSLGWEDCKEVMEGNAILARIGAP